MPLFRYEAINPLGKKVAGVMAADSVAIAKEQLRSQEILVTSLKILEKKERRGALSRSFLLSFTREMTQLLRAGLPLYEALLTIEEKYQKHPAHPTLLALAEKVKNGASLSVALKAESRAFDEIYLSIVRAAEQTGSLPTAFFSLAELLTKQNKLRKSLISAATYPLLLFGFSFIVLGTLLLYVVPSMQELFEGRALHPITGAVLAVSQFTNEYLGAIGLSFLAFCAALVTFVKHPKSRIYLEKTLFKIPLLKTLLLHAALARFSRTLATLLSGGVPLTDSLNLARCTLKYQLLEKLFEEVEKSVVQGGKMSEALQSPLMPPLISRMARIAEETGGFEAAFQHIATIYEEEVDRHLAELTAILQPLLIIALGALVGLILLSVLIPLTDVQSFLSYTNLSSRIGFGCASICAFGFPSRQPYLSSNIVCRDGSPKSQR